MTKSNSEAEDNIFHYTSNEGAIGIIKSKCMFASHWRYLNDSLELNIARDIVVPIFESEFRKVGSKLIEEGKLDREFLIAFGDRIYKDEAEKLYDIALRQTDNASPIFIASFCRHKPDSEQATDGLLSQWRGYGSSGGCAFEFSRDKLQKLIEWERESYAYTHVNLFDVVYTDHHKIIDLNYIEGIASDLLLNRANDSSSTREKLEKRLEGLYMAVAFLAPQMKNSYFREEQEVRIVAPLMRNTLASRISQKATREVHTRFRDGQPIPFIKVFEGAEGLPIKRVIVGPQQDQERVAYALELALEAQGLAVEIVRSQISYRP